MTSSNETNSAAPNLNTAPVSSDGNSSAPSSENKSEASTGEQGERRPRRFGKHPFKNRKPRGDRPPRPEGGERTPHPPGEQKVKPTFDPAQSDALFASVVSGEFDAALDAPEAEIANPNLANSSDEIAISHHAGVERRGGDHIIERHAHAEELRHGRHLVEGGSIDTKLVDIRRDRIGIKAVRQHGARHLEGEGALAVADVEQDAALAGGQHRGLDAALRVAGRVGEGAEAMGEDVAGAQLLDHLLIGGRRVVEMAHQRHADLLGHLQRHVEGGYALIPGGIAPDAHLDADDQVAVGGGDLRAFRRRHQADVLALAHHNGLREAVDAGERDMQIGEDTGIRSLDHMLAEAEPVARAGAAGVDGCRHARGACELVRIDAERRAAPIDMRVHVDQARRHDIAGDIAHFGAGIRLQIRLAGGHFAARERDIHDAVDLLGRIDDMAAFEDEIVGHGCEAPRLAFLA